MRRTKIVATLGPATEKPEEIRALIEAGADVIRLNQSHGSRAWHEAAFKAVRRESRALGTPVAIMVDLQGPKMRIGRVAEGEARLTAGSTLTLRHGADGVSDAENLYVPLREIINDLHPGDRVLIDDGNVILRVTSKRGGRVRAKVVAGGVISDGKGLNLPGVDLSVDAVTDKDLDDLEWAIGLGAEYVAVSFVRSAEDIRRVRSIIHKAGGSALVIAKIEKPEALAQIEDIARVADGLMVARGDLGVEMALEKVPVAQERIIDVAHKHDLPVIVATQMLESMTGKPRPTRAEVSDVAAAIFGGTDALMLSGETAVGRYPAESVTQMAAIAVEAERHMRETGALGAVFSTSAVYATADAVCHGAYSAAGDMGARAVFISTTSGRTALLFSKYRFDGVLVGASDRDEAVRRMALYWGVTPVKVRKCRDHGRLLSEIVAAARKRDLVSAGDTVVFVAGWPLGRSGATNVMMVRRVKPADGEGADEIIKGRTGLGTLMVNRKLCVLCGICAGICPVGIYDIDEEKVSFNRGSLKRCLADWRCRDSCPAGAIRVEGAPRDGEKDAS